MMEDEGTFLDNGIPNVKLKSVCDNLFFGSSEIAGNVGVKNLGYIVSAPNQEFEAYLDGLNALTSLEDDLSQ